MTNGWTDTEAIERDLDDTRSRLDATIGGLQQKLAPGTWQHTMLRDNLKALRLASALMEGSGSDATAASSEELEEAVAALGTMIDRVANTKTTFAEGSSHYSLQHNRLKALHVARAVVESELASR